jgi:hypothetical protein
VFEAGTTADGLYNGLLIKVAGNGIVTFWPGLINLVESTQLKTEINKPKIKKKYQKLA